MPCACATRRQWSECSLESTPDQSGYTVSLGEIAGYDEGHVGWFDGTFRFERERESVESRLTGVAHKENGQWRFVQMHVSIGVPNERIFEPMFRGQAAASSAGYQA